MGTKHNNFRTRTSTMISCKRDLVGHFYKWSSINKQQHVGTCSTITLGRYTRATLNTISCNPDSKWPNDLEGQGQGHSYLIPVKRISRCIFGANLMILTQIYFKLLPGQAKFPRILSQMAKMTLMVKVTVPYFRYQTRVSYDACMVQIWWFQPKFVTSYCVDNPNFPEFQVKMTKMTLEVNVNDPLFSIGVSQEYSKMHVWCTFGDSSPNKWRVIVQTR